MLPLSITSGLRRSWERRRGSWWSAKHGRPQQVRSPSGRWSWGLNPRQTLRTAMGKAGWWTLPSVKESALLAHKHLANKHLTNKLLAHKHLADKHLANKHLADHQGLVCLPRHLQGVWERPGLRIQPQSKRKRGVRS